MNAIDREHERLPVYLERYAAEADQWRRDVFTVRAAQTVPEELDTNPKDRALFARISSALADYDRTRAELARPFRR